MACYDRRVHRDLSMTTKLRSNKHSTQILLQAVNQYLDGTLTGSLQIGSVTVQPFTEQDADVSGLRISIVDNPICEIIKYRNRIDFIKIYDGNVYDSYGNLSSTTKERLNGILNFLAYEEILPDGIKAYLDVDSGVSFIGLGPSRVAFGKHYVRSVVIDADPDHFSMHAL